MAITKKFTSKELYSFDRVQDLMIEDTDWYIIHEIVVKDKDGNYWKYHKKVSIEDTKPNIFCGENGTSTTEWDRHTIDALKVEPVTRVIEFTDYVEATI